MRLTSRLLVAAAMIAAFAVLIPSAIAVHDEGLFELDGNVAAEAAPGDDWSTIFANASANALAQVFIQDAPSGPRTTSSSARK